MSKNEWLPWHLHSSIEAIEAIIFCKKKKKKVSIEVFRFSMPKGDLALYPQGFDFSCVSWMASDSEYKNLIRNDLDTCYLKEAKEPPSLIQNCSLAAISFLSSKLFFFHLFAEQKLRKWLWKELHSATDVLHINTWKYTESSGEYKLVLSTKSVNYKNAMHKRKINITVILPIVTWTKKLYLWSSDYKNLMQRINKIQEWTLPVC